MTRFTASTASEAVMAADRLDIWQVLTDPLQLQQLTPFLRRIEADGDLWRWHMAGLTVLGVGVTPVFTERMRFEEGRRIDYSHEPPPGVAEQAAAEGWYELTDVPGGTRLAIDLTLRIDVPLPRVAAPAVTRVMTTVMGRIGDRFSANLLRHLDAERAARSA